MPALASDFCSFFFKISPCLWDFLVGALQKVAFDAFAEVWFQRQGKGQRQESPEGRRQLSGTEFQFKQMT